MVAWIKEQAMLTVKIALPFTILFIAATGIGFLSRNLAKVTGWISSKT